MGLIPECVGCSHAVSILPAYCPELVLRAWELPRKLPGNPAIRLLPRYNLRLFERRYERFSTFISILWAA